MRQVFGEWGVVTETKSTSYGILSAPVASTIRGISHIVSEPARKELSARCTLRFVETFFNRLKGMFSTYILSQLEISFFFFYAGRYSNSKILPRFYQKRIVSTIKYKGGYF